MTRHSSTSKVTGHDLEDQGSIPGQGGNITRRCHIRIDALSEAPSYPDLLF
jgi:hypothetical protein